MMIKVNGEYLDFNDDIEVESQIKLFEEIDSTQGDWSYQSEMPDTNHNRKALGIPLPDTVKLIYNNVLCDIVDESGFITYSGTLRVENISEGTIKFSFFSGNNDWLGQLSSPMSNLPLQKYDKTLTETNIQASWSNTTGIIYPIVDTGALVTRSYSNVKVEDFAPFFYVKTLFNEIFGSKGIKIQGELLKDDLFNRLVVSSNSRNQEAVDDRSTYAAKNVNQTATTVETRCTFQNETTPYFDGAQNNWNTTVGEYTADIKMIVDVEVSFKLDNPSNRLVSLRLRKNPAGTQVKTGTTRDNSVSITLTNYPLEAFDELHVNVATDAGTATVLVGSYIKVTPVFLYKSFGSSAVPNWTQSEFVSNILRGFNALPSYNSQSKTLTLNLFNKIKDKEPIDVSDSIEVSEIDFSEFVSNYSKSNIFSYQEGSDEDLRQYNISNFISYGSGNIEIDNDFVQDSFDVVESDFTSPITYLNGVFDMSMERINFVEIEEIDNYTVSSVTDSGGVPRFNITDADDFFVVGDLIGIETDVDSYNGEWVINAVTSSYVTVNGLAYESNASGLGTLLRHRFTNEDNVYLMAVIPSVPVLFFSSKSSYMIGSSTTFLNASMAYFNILANGREINTKYKQSLSFGTVNNPLSYQMTMLQTYWPVFTAILSDPVMLKVLAYFNKKTYTDIKSFLRPLRVKTNETNNLYYLNRITGYKSGHEACEAELIKL